MTGESKDVRSVLAFGREGYFFRQIPYALLVGLLGVAMLVLRTDGGTKDLVDSWILITAGFGYTAFALWRRLSPAEPTLVLSPEGIRFRFTKRRTFVIPWDEVQGVDSADIRIGYRYCSLLERGVPVVMVSDGFYRSRIHIDSIWERGPGWNYWFIPKDGLVQITFFHVTFSQSADSLREAIERRWRAFSNNPNAKLPPQPRSALTRRTWLTRRQKLAVAAGVVILAAPLLWHWQWGMAWLAPAMPEGSSRVYLNRLLDGHGLPVRLDGGAVATVRRPDVRHIVAQECHNRIVRDHTTQELTPVYETEHHCLADLQLASGATAVAAFRLVVNTTRQEIQPGRYREYRAYVTAPLSPEEAERQICAARRCGS